MTEFQSGEILAQAGNHASRVPSNISKSHVSGELLLNTVLNHSSIILWAINRKGEYIYSRGAGLQHIGLDDDEVLGTSVYDAFANFPDILETLKNALQGEELHVFTRLNDTCFESWYCPFYHDDEVAGVVGISTVITELTQTKEKLQKSLRRLDAITSMAPVGIFQCDRAGKITYANEYFWNCVSKGENREHDQNQFWFDLFQSNSSNEWFEQLTDRQTFKDRLQPVNSPTEIEYVLVQIDAIDDRSCLGTLVDITAIHKSEQTTTLQKQELEKAVRQRTAELAQANNQLQKEVLQRKEIAQNLELSRNEFQAFLSTTVDMILQLDREGKVKYINWVLPGHKKEEVENSEVWDWLEGKTLELAKAAFEQVIETGTKVSIEGLVSAADGSEVLLSSHWGPVLHQGKVIGVSVVARDVTEQRHWEKQLAEKQHQLNHLSRFNLIGALSTSLAHELKQPLMAIGNYATGCLYQMQKRQMPAEEIANALQKIFQLSQRANQIIGNTRDFLKERPFQPVQMPVRSFITRSVELIQAELAKQEIRLEGNYAECSRTICVDEVQMQQVIVNLLMNAIEAIRLSEKETPPEITIQTRSESQSKVEIEIIDSGDGIKGIEPEDLFEAFQSSKEEGLGMGLAICRQIVENHGGKLTLKRSDTSGTCFQLTLMDCD